MSEPRLQRNDRIVFRRFEAGAGGVLLHLDSGEYRQLNETGALIWSLLEAGPTREELVAELRRVVTNPPPGLETEVDAFLAGLRERGLIDTVEASGDGSA